MHASRFLLLIPCCALLGMSLTPALKAANLCVHHHPVPGCYTSIQAAVNHAAPGDTIKVSRGTYKEYVTIGIPISILGEDADSTIVDATNQPHGFFVDGFDNANLANVTISGFTVENALFEGILVVSASNVTIRDNQVNNNDATSGLSFTGAPTGCPNQPGNGVYENDETGDCGGAIHLIGTAHSTLSDNSITGNADGVLISDETAESHDNLLIHNAVIDNPLECGIVLASHPPTGHTAPPFAPHFGVDHNTVAENVSIGNGVQIGGSGAGLFTDGMGTGHVVGNVIIHNKLVGNGLGGVALHTHVGPAFGLPADDMDDNVIVGNFIARNLPDQADTATPGNVGININSGGGGSPVHGTVIAYNIIRDEDVDIAVNTPTEVDIHLNDLGGGKIGVADVCAFDKATICNGTIEASENYWGCPHGPGSAGCATVSGSDISFVPWLQKPPEHADHEEHDRD
ncbi:right-handed parallel beta-helix repeat-containing protein [Alloacidobacterium dinghuense]|uniref:Right-handed parallel beta-helix repeat-containing protein n=1 Tax=Alloacidobacterium dinghuense TaxID=2763107 RepID=A0A7G8BFI9_9BACT|nr:NosD domain-containing protein [Alloacidobacterium dinghuense]QNI31309.1 right-handed parallel beta-helix repeat-containing protein [Alloacidobacterium dinghuense]